MARTAKSYTIVNISDGEIDTATYANADAVRDALAHRKDDLAKLLVFVGEPVEFTVDTTPRVTLGEKKERKPRAKKQKAKANAPAVTPQPIFTQAARES